MKTRSIVIAGTATAFPAITAAFAGTVWTQIRRVRNSDHPEQPAVMVAADEAVHAAEISDRPRQPGALRVVWIGDSTAAGTGATTREHALPSVVSRHMHGEVELHVLAVPGARIVDVLNDQVPRVAKYDPDIIMISAGANDVAGMTLRSRFRSMYADVLAGLPETAEVVALGIPDIGSAPVLPHPLKLIAGCRAMMLDRIIRQQATKVGALFAAFPKRTGLNAVECMSADLYHPGDVGYRVWGEHVINVLRSYETAWLVPIAATD